jgi:hypothetical protein
MTEFEMALQECLRDLEQGYSSVDECLHRYPKHAEQLEPILLTSAYLQQGHEARPSAAFKVRVRTKLVQQMYAHPRKPARSNFMFMRLAVSLAALVLALLVTGTVYAQGVLPGNAFYPWKLASENVWRAVSPDPVGTDLVIAERRVSELIAVSDNPTLYSQVLKAYLDLVDRLKSEVDTGNKAHILTVLDSQAEELNQLGIVLPQTDQSIIPPSEEPTLTPISTSTPTPTPLPILETPQVDPTNVPQIVPTIQVPPEPEIIPTIQAPLKIIPTIEIPPPIP